MPHDAAAELDFVRRLGSLAPQPQHGHIPLHRPLLLLWALGRVAAGLPRLTEWQELRLAFEELAARDGNAANPDAAVYPFWVLQRDRLWKVEGAERLELTSGGRRPTLASLDTVNPRGGLIDTDHERLRAQPDLLLASAALLLIKFFNPIPPGLLAAVGLNDGLTGREAKALLPAPGARYVNRTAIWEAHGGQKVQGIGPLADGLTSVFADDEGPYADRLIEGTNLIEYRGDGLVGDQRLKNGNARLADCQARREPVRYWHRPASGEFTFETWAVIVDRRYVWGRDTNKQRRREFAWVLAPVNSPFRDSWPDEVRAYLEADDGETHDDTTETRIPATVDIVDAGRYYIELCRSVEDHEPQNYGRTSRTAIERHFRSANARLAVMLRAAGRCENPECTGQPADVTDNGDPILEVDHINDLARNGRDYPAHMIALCPNCHAIKTRGRTRTALRRRLLTVARRQHQRFVTNSYRAANPVPR